MQGGDQPPALPGGQLAQADLGVPLGALVDRGRAEVPAPVLGVRALDADEQEGREGERLHQQGDDVQGEVVGPVQVVQDQDEPAPPGERDDQVPQREERLLTGSLGARRPHEFPSRAELDREQIGDQRRQLAEALLGQDPSSTRPRSVATRRAARAVSSCSTVQAKQARNKSRNGQ